tara:strand:+ start:1559 stop:1750 length:192 start_codon:yes stop_codon:yes gene_type:complete
MSKVRCQKCFDRGVLFYCEGKGEVDALLCKCSDIKNPDLEEIVVGGLCFPAPPYPLRADKFSN